MLRLLTVHLVNYLFSVFFFFFPINYRLLELNVILAWIVVPLRPTVRNDQLAGILFTFCGSFVCLVLKQVESKRSCKHVLLLAYQSVGIVFGDLSISPLYVYKSAFSGKLSHYQNEDTVFGICSLIFWTFTILALLKYVMILLNADDNGEGK